jgi:SAM-dependent methyltransferase
MTTDTPENSLAALVDLFRGLDRKGPGDAGFTRDLLRDLPPLPREGRIADLGCGGGAGSLLLAEYYRREVLAVDSSPVFLEELSGRASRAGFDPFITPVRGDMGALDWPAASVALLWSEGAAYILGFESALRAWRPLLSKDGLAVVSEMSWFTQTRPRPALTFWREAYPTMGDEAENVGRARRAGFEVLETRRLPLSAWWTNFYDPLRARMKELDGSAFHAAVLRETEEEIALFEKYGDAYGYSFYVMRAIS